MNAILNLPLELRMAILFVVGTCVGGQVNHGIYRLAWNARSISPWSRKPPDTAERTWFDRIPVLGWIGMRREAEIHGRGFWIRPMFLELLLGVGLAALYYWEVTGGLLPSGPGVLAPSPWMIHAQFLSHSVLICMMVVATFIDFDEKTIPDEIAVSGALLGITLAALFPTSLLPITAVSFGTIGAQAVVPIHVGSPLDWPHTLHSKQGLILGMVCYLGWCFALLPRIWTTRRGLPKAFAYLVEGMRRHTNWKLMSAMVVVGLVGITAVWSVGGVRWQSMLTALVGLAFGGLMIWSVRIAGGVALGQEAMGFGDVTLMAMIGSFIGWQSCTIAFLLAPFSALFISITQYIVTRRKDIAFGPYLCLGALILIVKWNAIWESTHHVYSMGWYIIVAFFVCVVLMGVMLVSWVFIRDRLLFPEYEEEPSDENPESPDTCDDSDIPSLTSPQSSPADPEQPPL